MTPLSLPTLRHLQDLCTHALGYLSNLRDLELRARTLTVSQEDHQFAWSTLHRTYLENLLQVVFQYFRTLNSLEDLQESTRQPEPAIPVTFDATELNAILLRAAQMFDNQVGVLTLLSKPISTQHLAAIDFRHVL
jgi:hypothetical protein